MFCSMILLMNKLNPVITKKSTILNSCSDTTQQHLIRVNHWHFLLLIWYGHSPLFLLWMHICLHIEELVIYSSLY
jgi:hypothetical protein